MQIKIDTTFRGARRFSATAIGVDLCRGDLIEQVNGQAVRNAREFLDVVAAVPGEQALNLKLIRNQKAQTLNIDALTKL